MVTKAIRRFEQRVDYYGTDLELCDLLVRAFARRANSEDNLAVDLGSDADRHPILGRRRNTRASRGICGNHLKSTLAIAFIKDLYEDFSEYLATIMTNAAMKGINPARFVGNVKLDLHATDILSAGNWDGAVRAISDAIFRKLENERNTRDLVRKASERLGLNVEQAVLDAAMPYLDARHILVHRDGKTDEKYRNDYPTIPLRNDKLVVDFALVSNAKIAVSALAREIDDKLIAADLVRAKDLDGNR